MTRPRKATRGQICSHRQSPVSPTPGNDSQTPHGFVGDTSWCGWTPNTTFNQNASTALTRILRAIWLFSPLQSYEEDRRA